LALDAAADWQLDGTPVALEPVALEPVALEPVALEPVALVAINLIHISPWSVCRGLMRNAGRLLATGGQVVLYGPFRREGRHTAPSNRDFDASLKAKDPAWGVRDLEAVSAEAAGNSLVLAEIVEMPANNLTVVFDKASAP